MSDENEKTTPVAEVMAAPEPGHELAAMTCSVTPEMDGAQVAVIAQQLDPDLQLAVQQGNSAVIEAIKAGATTTQQVVQRMIQCGNTTNLPSGVQVLVNEELQRQKAQEAEKVGPGKSAEAAAAAEGHSGILGIPGMGIMGAAGRSSDYESKGLTGPIPGSMISAEMYILGMALIASQKSYTQMTATEQDTFLETARSISYEDFSGLSQDKRFDLYHNVGTAADGINDKAGDKLVDLDKAMADNVLLGETAEERKAMKAELDKISGAAQTQAWQDPGAAADTSKRVELLQEYIIKGVAESQVVPEDKKKEIAALVIQRDLAREATIASAVGSSKEKDAEKQDRQGDVPAAHVDAAQGADNTVGAEKALAKVNRGTRVLESEIGPKLQEQAANAGGPVNRHAAVQSSDAGLAVAARYASDAGVRQSDVRAAGDDNWLAGQAVHAQVDASVQQTDMAANIVQGHGADDFAAPAPTAAGPRLTVKADQLAEARAGFDPNQGPAAAGPAAPPPKPAASGPSGGNLFL